MRPDEVKNVKFIKASANRWAESQNGITPERSGPLQDPGWVFSGRV